MLILRKGFLGGLVEPAGLYSPGAAKSQTGMNDSICGIKKSFSIQTQNSSPK